MFSFASTKFIFDQGITCIALDTYGDFSLLQNCFHEEWALCYSYTLETRPTYTPLICFETFPFPFPFPFPFNLSGLNDIGERYYEHRKSIMQTRQEGLTKTYNRFHDPKETAADIQKLRELHVEMDEAVAAAYGWSDLKLQHGFHDTKQGLRYTISEAARREVLDRLLRLNHERYAEEVRQGLHDKKGGKAKVQRDEAVADGEFSLAAGDGGTKKRGRKGK
jgi:hypothetical protein